MSDMPDFDSMSPEEMMKWMESLAKRQGAAEGFTTEADLEIDEVDENDERLAGQGEYKPYGMSDEEWAKMQEREAAQKAERLAQQESAPAQPAAQAAPPTPEPEPEPAVAEAAPATGGDDAPDFDNMSPEEMMEWMESLAKRQGADEGFTTSASMSVAEVDANDERLAGQSEYKPYGMSDDEWAKMQEREAEQKAAKQASKQQEIPPQAVAEPAPPAPEPEPEPVVAEVAPAADGELDFDNMSPEEMMEWMESLAKRQGADEGFTTSASMSVAEVDANDERLAGQGEYKPYGMSDDEWAKMQEREAAQKAAKQAAQSAEPQVIAEEEPEYEYEDDEEYVDYADDDEIFLESTGDSDDFLAGILENNNVIGDDDAAEDALPSFDDILPAEPIAEAESPMDWLAGLSAGDDDAPDLNFDLGDMSDLGDLGGLGELTEAEEAGDPMAWLAGLSADDDTTQAPDLSALMAGEADDTEGTMEWMETLAADEGADSEEFMTAAGLDIPRPDALVEDGPGYEDFSFEEATGMLQDNEIGASAGASSGGEMDLDDPEGWLDNLAAGVGGNDIPDGFFDGGMDNELPDNLFDDEAFEQAEAERAEEGEFDNLADNVKAQMESGRLGDSPDDINAFFESAFAKAATRDDVPDYLDDDEDEDALVEDDESLPVQAEIPDWLQESMSAAPILPDEGDSEDDVPAKRATAEMMIQDLGLDDEIEEAEIPDWLQADMSEDTGIIENDIFATEGIEDGEPTIAGVTDTQDTWVDAFSTEESDELASWYETAVAGLEDGGASDAEPQVIEAQASAVSSEDVSLTAADLPVETRLEEGSPQNVPDWFGVSKEQSVEVQAVQNDMSWLSDDFGDDGEGEMVFTTPIEDDVDMPDWLQDTVDDSVTADEDLPEWLAGETDISVEDIPDWLRETMDEEEEPVAADIFAEGFLEDDEDDDITPEPAAPVPTTPSVPAVVTQSPAPVPVAASTIDAVAYLRSAKEKISSDDIDGAMLDYEQVIRANKALGQVEKELIRLSEDDKGKKNPAVNRVLGDVLMRQGKLQEALDTYRKALNML